MCRMWVIFKAARVLALDVKHQRLSRWGELQIQLEKNDVSKDKNKVNALYLQQIQLQAYVRKKCV